MNTMDGTAYEGEWKNGTVTGKGTLRHSDGSVYTGTIKCGIQTG